MPDEDNNFVGSLVLDFRIWWRRVQPKNKLSQKIEIREKIRVINKQRAKVLGDVRYSELELFGIRVSLKIIVFSMETPGWSPSEGLQHGAGNQWKHLEFSLALS